MFVYLLFPKDPKTAIKGYICYKMITFQDVPSEAHVENFFVS